MVSWAVKAGSLRNSGAWPRGRLDPSTGDFPGNPDPPTQGAHDKPVRDASQLTRNGSR
jgi:hypothetical protein